MKLSRIILLSTLAILFLADICLAKTHDEPNLRFGTKSRRRQAPAAAAAPAAGAAAAAKPAAAAGAPAAGAPAAGAPAAGAAAGNATAGNATAGGNATGGNGSVGNITGIETTESQPPLKRCTQTFVLDGERIVDISNYHIREKAVLQMNIYNVNVFKSRTPDSLVESLEWAHTIFPIKNFTGAPDCLRFTSKVEKKDFAFCFAQPDQLDAVVGLVKGIRYCRIGVSPQESTKKCDGSGDSGLPGDEPQVAPSPVDSASSTPAAKPADDGCPGCS